MYYSLSYISKSRQYFISEVDGDKITHIKEVGYLYYKALRAFNMFLNGDD